MSEHILIDRQDRVTTLTLSREDKKNAITQAMYATLADEIAAYGTDDSTRALMITGVGDVFTAGNDLADFSMGGGNGGDVPPVVRFLTEISTCPKPIIAAVNGLAIGVGLTMLLHCDLVYASESARLSAPFVGLGLVPEAASSLLLPAAVGMAVANDIFLTGRQLTAEEAHQYGLVARVFPDADLQTETRALAHRVAASAPEAVKHAKALVRTQRDRIAKQMETEGHIFAAQLRSPEFAESVVALREKRAPVYK
ncbi:enoyl-CoA hydratase [Thalassococcus sp. S3]|uniref:enoyl-CoA hydratase n=1 Tax=Thalassococcus sp. S3 TaxID=2017482 RepID=UPI00102485BA|nr:enoyl-CoA hydratase [Thalassococcus sp. S3]QBF33669.1 enoyl-CoA hydratase [Thalassococcus sp. S3]